MTDKPQPPEWSLRTVLEHRFVAAPQLPPERLPNTQHRALCKTIECLYARVVVLEDIISSVGAEHHLKTAFGGRICTLKEIKASYCQDQTYPRLSKCIAPHCSKAYQSAENLPRHIRGTWDRSHQFHRAILTGTFCFQCGMEFSAGTSSLSRHERDRHGEPSTSRIETFGPFRTAFSRGGGLPYMQPNDNHVAGRSVRKASEAGSERDSSIGRLVQVSTDTSTAERCDDGSVLREEVMKIFKQFSTRIEQVEKDNDHLHEIVGGKKRKRGDDKTCTAPAKPGSINGHTSAFARDRSNCASTMAYSAQVSSSDSAASVDDFCNPGFNPSPVPPAQLQPFSSHSIYEINSGPDPFPLPLTNVNGSIYPAQLQPFSRSIYEIGPGPNPSQVPPTGTDGSIYPALLFPFPSESIYGCPSPNF
ncbi:hypothetical protein BDBG_00586 [Blastomyces gilchristii SLH14081]|uniref:Uncharacterized protein n=1 Tax=Blastomyces gilchristii (strain SLH14081) TaxID=559298 RepID=A0A179U7I5_BLAGS|nr:uncharacterized protein BDBG_00586 [Blastomyces gilchristii SLH14081]OAT03934.1 hypothetical protein BDBG_00586 [Blastomyces gilchristii SLH14081]